MNYHNGFDGGYHTSPRKERGHVGRNPHPNEQASGPGKKLTGRWTKEEHQRFVDGLSKFGKNWKKVEEHVGSRTGAQIRSHAQKFFNRIQRENPSQMDENQDSESLGNFNFSLGMKRVRQ
jgi:SHAQKYF class myb-like DNA-binding protein